MRFGFLEFNFIDIIDILAVAVILYMMYKILKGSIALNVFIGFLFIYVFWFIVRALHMRLLSTILGQFIGVGAIALLVVFQQEIRRFLLLIGKNHMLFSNEGQWKRFLPWNWNKLEEQEINFEEIAKACHYFSSTKTGALMVVGRTSELKLYGSTGIYMNAELSAKLLEAIFFNKNPLHDGAVIITKNIIVAASCILPVSDRQDLPLEYGLRHRSGIGISEHSDAIAIIISEETGQIAIANKGEIVPNIPINDLVNVLQEEYYEMVS